MDNVSTVDSDVALDLRCALEKYGWTQSSSNSSASDIGTVRPATLVTMMDGAVYVVDELGAWHKLESL